MMALDITQFSSLAADSRSVVPGALFVATPGTTTDGSAYVADAVARGAAGVVVAQTAVLPPLPPEVPVVRVENVRLALSELAAAFYPAQPAHSVAVTGTDGKTSTVDFFRQLAHLAGHKAASIGTLGVIAGDGTILQPATHTTPDPIALHRILQGLAEKGITHVAMEASSHGLDQYRLHGVRVEAAAFTNLTRDHLDYHKTEAAYLAAKRRLFTEFAPTTAVMNADDPQTMFPLAPNMRRIDFGQRAQALRILSVMPHAQGQRVVCEWMGTPYTLDVPLVGGFQVMNICAAIGLLVGTGESFEALLPLIPSLTGVPGRLEPVGHQIFVDYAHTPGALAKALETLRPHTRGRLGVVFGCGGDRDPGKRPQMGEVASRLADVVIVTDDNPRSEDPGAIRRAILTACPGAQEIGDRGEAIRAAMAALREGDALLIAGKGHETEQIYGTTAHHFSDVEVVRALLDPHAQRGAV